jgi:hypothetical protein
MRLFSIGESSPLVSMLFPKEVSGEDARNSCVAYDVNAEKTMMCLHAESLNERFALVIIAV